MSISAYKRTIRDTEGPRDIERRILSQITGELEKHQEIFDKAEPKARKAMLTDDIRKAVWENQRLWLTLKADLISEENQLSAEIKGTLISLAVWVDKHTSKVFTGEETILPLIDMNKNIISGLTRSS